MPELDTYVGQRQSLRGQTCTVRFVGTVEGKQGIWLGVEWDDTSRGKHNGTHDGVEYFACRSQSATPASFLRPQQEWDSRRTFLDALREKYISPQDATNAEIVYISGKLAEEVGLEKLASRQAKLEGIYTLVLERMCVHHRSIDHETEEEISRLCVGITSLDLTGNLFETLDEVLHLCRLMPKLTSLTLNGNRIHVASDLAKELPTIRYLSLSSTLLRPAEIAELCAICPTLVELVLANNELSRWDQGLLPASLQSLDLSLNDIEVLSDLQALTGLPSLRALLLKQNAIALVAGSESTRSFLALQELDLRTNAIVSWSFFDKLPAMCPSVIHLRTGGNPLYLDLRSAEGKLLTSEDGYILTIARLPHLQTLNYSRISDKERLNAETYYLGQIAAQLSLVPTSQRNEMLGLHPRWQALCEEYGDPAIAEVRSATDIDPKSLAARLVRLTLYTCEAGLASSKKLPWTLDWPKSLSIYTLLGLVGRELDVSTLKLRLTLETGERDPVRTTQNDGPEWWDSSDEEDEAVGRQQWIDREVELVPGTRLLATYIDGQEGTIRVELR
ncbi:hypothetical protein B0A48_08013 [Cryoendolithus antarcticus]|uniref:CAP-Gly domain-containing protein n=1 Tax=Cryoendolithus antarcticus TaxID=1507870 RepID=A0A1V8T0Y7_9PEZI|nr:hypothetical protein B0A48_08013 [Cryoendolithus antarcticus]